MTPLHPLDELRWDHVRQMAEDCHRIAGLYTSDRFTRLELARSMFIDGMAVLEAIAGECS